MGRQKPFGGEQYASIRLIDDQLERAHLFIIPFGQRQSAISTARGLLMATPAAVLTVGRGPRGARRSPGCSTEWNHIGKDMHHKIHIHPDIAGHPVTFTGLRFDEVNVNVQ